MVNSNNAITTIKITKKTKERLDSLKEYKRESYEEVLEKMLNIFNITIRNPVAGAKILRNIKRKKDSVYSSIPKEIAQESQKPQEKPKHEQTKTA